MSQCKHNMITGWYVLFLNRITLNGLYIPPSYNLYLYYVFPFNAILIFRTKLCYLLLFICGLSLAFLLYHS